MSSATDLKVYRLLHRQRRKKVFGLYKLALSVVIDFTIVLYLLGFAAMAMAFVWENIIVKLQGYAVAQYPPATVSLVASLILLTFTMIWTVSTPRYKLTYSDYLLHFLPHDIERYVRYVFINQQVVRLAVFTVISLVLWLLKLLSPVQVGYLFVTFLIVDAFYGLLQWKIYQHTFIVRTLLAVLCMILGVAAFGFLLALSRTHSPIVVYLSTMGAFVVLLTVLASRKFTRSLAWERVVNYGEDATWNPLLIKTMLQTSSTPINRPWILKNTASKTKKKPVKSLPYDLTRILQQYWWRYLPSKRQLLLRAFMILLALCGAVYRFDIPLPESNLFAIASVVLMLIGREILTERLTTMHFAVLPWPIPAYVESFWRNTWWGVLPFCLIQIIMLASRHAPFYIGVLLVLGEIPLYLLLYRTLLRSAMQKLTGRVGVTLEHIALTILYICALLMLGLFPWVAVPLNVVISYQLWKQRKKWNSATTAG